MKLALSLLLVCVSMMVCQAAPVEDDSASATVTGEKALATSNTFKWPQFREAFSSGRAGKGTVIVNSRSYTSGDNTAAAAAAAEAGTDKANAQAGTDKANAQAGTDTANAQSGTDKANAQAGTDKANAQAGTDTANAQSGTDNANAQASTNNANAVAGTNKANAEIIDEQEYGWN